MKQKINGILKQMSLQDKIALCSGSDFWQTKKFNQYGIPSIFMCDGPNGLRKQESNGKADMLGVHESRPATCFPTPVTTACSWDIGLMERIGAAIGEEAAAGRVGLVLGPGANIKRDPLCGRNFEYISEDPYLAGKMAAGMIRGLQANGTGASLKHFACNSQEYSRFNSDSVMDERTLREIYLTAFEIAIKEAKPATVMCAYNKINGVHCSDNKYLLTDILRKEWGFDGTVVTDWGAMNDRIEGFRAGCDLSMPGGSDYMEKEVLEAVRSGKLPENAIDNSAGRILELVLRKVKDPKHARGFDQAAHHKLAREAAEQGAVLLKNQNGILPIQKSQKVAVIGAMARTPRYQGSGSSHINPFRVSSALDAMPHAIYAEGCSDRGDTDDAMLAEAVRAATEAEVTVVFAGLPGRYESEGFDRDDLQIPKGHLRMIEAMAAANSNTVVVLLCGCVVECPWADQVKGILYMGLAGQAVGEAIVNLLYGKVNPSGKLAETWPLRYEDCPTAACYKGNKDARYCEGIYVGYRYFGTADVPVRWPFGYGLSYTGFAYSDLRIEGDTVTAVITNTGNVPGAETVQLYIKPPKGGLHRPAKELKGFCKVRILPGQSETVRFVLSDRSFAVWAGNWVVPGGTYTVYIGSSSLDLPLEGAIEKKGEMIPTPQWQAGSWYEAPRGAISQSEWEAMLGRKYMEVLPKKGSYTMDNTLLEMKDHSLVMKFMFKAVEGNISKAFDGKKDYENPQFRMLMLSSAGSPLRNMQICGGIKGSLFKGLLEMANGHYLRGVIKIIKG